MESQNCFTSPHSLIVKSVQDDNICLSLTGLYRLWPTDCYFFTPDLDEWMENVAEPSDYESFRHQLERTVVWRDATETFMDGQNGFAVTRHSGLTTYVEQPEFPSLNDAYRRLSWYSATR